MSDSWYSEEHKALQTTLKKIIDTDINPNVDQWENEGQYPAHEVFKKLGDAGLMGEWKTNFQVIVNLINLHIYKDLDIAAKKRWKNTLQLTLHK